MICCVIFGCIPILFSYLKPLFRKEQEGKKSAKGSSLSSKIPLCSVFTAKAYALASYIVCEHYGVKGNAAYACHISAFIISLFLMTVPRIPQSLEYHNFADKRSWCSCGGKAGFVPNAFDVLSNVPFLIGALLGYDALVGGPLSALAPMHSVQASAWERTTAWPFFFFGVGVTCFGSAYYHWNPNNATLVWDRLPMTVAFMSLFSIVLEERLHVGHLVLTPFLVIGALTVAYWHYTEQAGNGDLRPYLVVQFFPLLAIPVLLLTQPAQYSDINTYCQVG